MAVSNFAPLRIGMSQVLPPVVSIFGAAMQHMQLVVQYKHILASDDGSDIGIHIMGGEVVEMWRSFGH